jgi:hypothetical protein
MIRLEFSASSSKTSRHIIRKAVKMRMRMKIFRCLCQHGTRFAWIVLTITFMLWALWLIFIFVAPVFSLTFYQVPKYVSIVLIGLLGISQGVCAISLAFVLRHKFHVCTKCFKAVEQAGDCLVCPRCLHQFSRDDLYLQWSDILAAPGAAKLALHDVQQRIRNNQS